MNDMKIINNEISKTYIASYRFNKNMKIKEKELVKKLGKASIFSLMTFYLFKFFHNLKFWKVKGGSVIAQSAITTTAIAGTMATATVTTALLSMNNVKPIKKETIIKEIKPNIIIEQKKNIKVEYNQFILLSGEIIKAQILELKNNKFRLKDYKSGKIFDIEESKIFSIK